MKVFSIYKIKSEYLDTWIQWCREIQTTYFNDSRESLIYEQVLSEACAIFQTDSGHYVIGFQEYGDSTIIKSADMTAPLNIKHKEMRRLCLEKISDGQTLYDITTHTIA